MTCKWQYLDCENEDKKCYLCSTDGYHYKPKKIKKNYFLGRKAKITNRKGAKTEYDNHNFNADVLSGVEARMTPNSGAGHVKGDEEIRGLVEIMEEVKTSDVVNSKGENQFTIKKIWLEKLEKEAFEANKEFFYIKFRFGENAKKFYTIINSEEQMSWVKTLAEDRKKVNKLELEKDISEKRRRVIEAENIKLYAEIELLKAKLKYQNFMEDNNE